jgi:hypothetical protein
LKDEIDKKKTFKKNIELLEGEIEIEKKNFKN